MMPTQAQRLQRRIAKRSARLLGRFVAPLTVFKATGVMPCTEAPTAPQLLRSHDEPPVFTHPPPSSLGTQRAWSTSHSNHIAKTRVVSVPQGIALSTGAVFEQRGRFLPLASHDHDFADQPRRQRRSFVLEPHRFFPGIHNFRRDVVTLTTSNQDFYFHWIFDVLPRLSLAEQAGYGNGPFYVQARLPFQRQTLCMLGVSECNLIDSRGTRAISASNLVVPCHRVAPGHAFPDWSIRFLRDRILPKVSAIRRSSQTRLYISRRDAGHRRVSNEIEILAFLSRFGFQPIQLEKLAFHDQVSLFRDAEIVIAPHGGGLANLVFAKPGTRVIELFPPGNIDLYYRLAMQLGLNYLFVKSGDGPDKPMGSEDYQIEVADLRTALCRADA
jgi:capsular polysaccharide biosynthesis protein